MRLRNAVFALWNLMGLVAVCLQGVYHQVKELERVLSPHYRVKIMLSEYMFPHTDPADDEALYILMTPHLCVDLPPHYIIWQTEQVTSPPFVSTWCTVTINHHAILEPPELTQQFRQYVPNAKVRTCSVSADFVLHGTAPLFA